jgi:hypothetical protein
MHLASLLLAASAMAAGVEASEGVASVPLYMWSEQLYFSAGGSSHLRSEKVLSQSQLSQTIDQLLEPPTTSKLAVPEVVLAFVHNKLGTSQAARYSGAYSHSTPPDDAAGFSYLQEAMAESRSSVVFPYVVDTKADEGSLSISEQLISSVSRVNPSAQTIAFQLGQENPEDFEGDAVEGCDALLAHIQDEGADVFSNGRTDLILVKAQKPEDMKDVCVKRVDAYVNQATEGKSLSLLSADASSSPIQLTFDAAPQQLFQARGPGLRQAADGATIVYVGPEYINSGILTGLLVSFLLIFIAMCAVSCLMSIETPVRFGDRMLQIGKEY